MTLDDWLAARSAGPLSAEISVLSDRKTQLLTAAFLRRVWRFLPSHHTQIAVEATEAFADGRMAKRDLVRLRVMDARETSEPLWFSSNPDWPAGSWLDAWDYWGDDVFAVYEERAAELEQRVANYGFTLPCVKAGIEWPHWVAAKAAFLARDLRPAASPKEYREATAQFALFREIGGDGSRPDARWRTADVRAIAFGIHRDRAFDQLPILADALQDAGCDDQSVLLHCREEKKHVRGCWVLDLAMGVAERDALHHPALLQPERPRHAARKFTQFVRYKE